MVRHDFMQVGGWLLEQFVLNNSKNYHVEWMAPLYSKNN